MSTEVYRPRGLYFEEMEVGSSVVSPGRTVTEADIVAFCGISGDYNELHSNAEFAKQTLFGQRIAHGLLGLAMASGLASRLGLMEGTAQAFMGLEWKFKQAILIGDTVRVRVRVKKKREIKRLDGGLVFVDVAVVNQEDQVVQEGQWTMLIKSQPPTEEKGRADPD
ncbi:MAG TPA: MaoC/PaaZ C-terminal domain-containing protein [Anaerolineae bacterium]|nr:MaoC/PaaZ C-terminal domain-containing protein [Anaerolineae bacterium]